MFNSSVTKTGNGNRCGKVCESGFCVYGRRSHYLEENKTFPVWWQSFPQSLAESWKNHPRVSFFSPFTPKGSGKTCTGDMPRPTESETLGMRFRNIYFRKTSMCCWCGLELENHCFEEIVFVKAVWKWFACMYSEHSRYRSVPSSPVSYLSCFGNVSRKLFPISFVLSLSIFQALMLSILWYLFFQQSHVSLSPISSSGLWLTSNYRLFRKAQLLE